MIMIEWEREKVWNRRKEWVIKTKDTSEAWLYEKSIMQIVPQFRLSQSWGGNEEGKRDIMDVFG